jgi:uncharacterized RDD family membrane protein YckC
MRCPKCHYLSFEPEPRCRNCGYGLSLDEGDLFIRESDGDASPFADLSLQPPVSDEAEAFVAELAESPRVADRPVWAPSVTPAVGVASVRAADAVARSEPPASEPMRSPARPAPPTTELPLFVKAAPDLSVDAARVAENPPVRVPAEPRPPLAVRRNVSDSMPVKPRSATAPSKVGPLDRDLLAELQRLEPRVAASSRSDSRASMASEALRVPAPKRLAAAAVDGVFLAALDMAVLWVVFRWTGAPIAQLATPSILLPTVVFLSLVDVGYLLMFTAAAGQTIGKMALGIRVIDDVTSPDEGGALTLRQALYRAVLTLPSVLAVGAGFIPVLIGGERALHDRLAHTRVVRA